MQGEAIFWPVLVQAGLTYGIYFLASSRRMAAIAAGEAKPGQFKIPGPGNEPERSATVMRNLDNQFELPVLFFACCLALFVLNAAGTAAISARMGFCAVAARTRLRACDKQPAEVPPPRVYRRILLSGRDVGAPGMAACGGRLTAENLRRFRLNSKSLMKPTRFKARDLGRKS